MISGIEIVKRLLLSAVVASLIGVEREFNNRPAGLRTHILVSVGSTLIMLISIDGFYRIGNSIHLGDPARLAAQVVSGIGFLGAGTIMKTGNNIKGLTTAASLWVISGIGLAIGAGYYLGALVTAGIVLVVLISLGYIEKRVLKRRYKTFEVISINRHGLIGEIGTLLGKYHISIRNIAIINNGNEFTENEDSGILEIHFLVKAPANLNHDEFYKEIYKIRGIFNAVFNGEKIPYN